MATARITYTHKKGGKEHSIRVKTGIETIREVLGKLPTGPTLVSVKVWIFPTTERRSREIPMYSVKLEDGTYWNCEHGFVGMQNSLVRPPKKKLASAHDTADDCLNKDGSVSKRGFALGCVEKKTGDGYELTISQENGAFHVKGFVDDPTMSSVSTDRHVYESFPTAGAARKYRDSEIATQKRMSA